MEKKEFEIALGRWLFKYRSYLPVPVLIILFVYTKPGIPFGTPYMEIAKDIFGLLVLLMGFAIRVLVIGYKKPGTSGRGTNMDVSTVVTDGAYQMCRNPLYLGNFFNWLGLVIIWWDGVFAAVIIGFFAVEYYFIIKSEEAYLSEKFGKIYNDYKKSVPAFFPKRITFSLPDRPFNMKKVVATESKLLMLLLAFPAVFEIFKYKMWQSNSKLVMMGLLEYVALVIIGWLFINGKYAENKNTEGR